MSSNTIDEKKLAEAKEKLACHIERPAATQEKDSPAGTDNRVKLTQMTSAGG